MKTLTTNSSKEEEIQFLKEVASMCGSGSYLHELFTEKFMAMIEHDIKNDFYPDVMDKIEALQKEGTEKSSKCLELSSEIARLEKTMELKDSRIEELLSRLETFRKEFDATLTRSVDLQDKLIEKEDELAGKTQEIITLKAALYDLEHPSK